MKRRTSGRSFNKNFHNEFKYLWDLSMVCNTEEDSLYWDQHPRIVFPTVVSLRLSKNSVKRGKEIKILNAPKSSQKQPEMILDTSHTTRNIITVHSNHPRSSSWESLLSSSSKSPSPSSCRYRLGHGKPLHDSAWDRNAAAFIPITLDTLCLPNGGTIRLDDG